MRSYPEEWYWPWTVWLKYEGLEHTNEWYWLYQDWYEYLVYPWIGGPYRD